MSLQRPRIKLLLSKRTNDGLVTYAQVTSDGINANANYPLPPDLADYQAKIENTRNAILAWGTIFNRGSRSDRAALGVARRELEIAMMRMASYCESATPYDAPAFLNAGWEVKNAPTPPQPLNAPANLRQVLRFMLPPGEVKIRCNKVNGAKSYVFWRDPVGAETSPTYYNSTNTSLKVTDLVQGQLYHFRVAALGALGMGAVSDVCEVRVSI